MRKIPFVLAAAALLSATAVAAAEPAKDSAVERGRYLATIGGCHDCHTPFKMGPKGPEPDMTKMLSGHPEGMLMPDPPAPQGAWIWSGAATNTAFAGPWGVSYAVNLTPDEETGMPGFTEQRFIQSMRNGKHLGMGRPILPPMPWPNVGQMTDEDLKALYAFLRSVPPVKNRVPDAKPASPPAGPPPATH